jgi:anti-sigma-K factor RskA
MESGDHRHHEEQLAAYLLGALDDDEARSFRSHLETCERCQADARWLQPAVEVLPTSVPQLEPPPELKARLLDTVRGEAAAAERAARPRRAPRRRWALSLRPAVALGAAGLIAAGIGGYLIGDDSGTRTTTVTASSPREPGARLTVARRGDSAVVRVARLPVQKRGHVYQLWVRDGQRIDASSLFVVRRDGSGAAAIPAGLEGAEEVMVTMEPEGGSTTPSMEPLLRVKL